MSIVNSGNTTCHGHATISLLTFSPPELKSETYNSSIQLNLSISHCLTFACFNQDWEFQRGNSIYRSLENFVPNSNINNSHELVTARIRSFNTANFPLSSSSTQIDDHNDITNFKVLRRKEPLLTGADVG